MSGSEPDDRYKLVFECTHFVYELRIV